MNTDQKIIKNKVGLLNLADMLGNVSEGSYNSYLECWAEPQFDPGSGNRHWITQVHFLSQFTLRA